MELEEFSNGRAIDDSEDIDDFLKAINIPNLKNIISTYESRYKLRLDNVDSKNEDALDRFFKSLGVTNEQALLLVGVDQFIYQQYTTGRYTTTSYK